MTNISLKVKTKNGQQVINSLTKESTIKDLMQILSAVSNIPINRLQVLTGFPPKNLDVSKDDLSLGNAGLSTGDALILQETPTQDMERSLTTPSPVSTQTEDSFSETLGILRKLVVPADNSCLFTSIHFVLNGKLDESGEAAPYLRQLVAETIRNDPQNYDEAILGKPVIEYCTWIQNDTSWGGAIELAILANYYGIEIAVVDIVNGIINRFGEDQNYPVRVFLMFDGIHYDPLYLEPITGDKIHTLFETTNERVFRDAQTLAQEAKSNRQYTDVNKFTIKCNICNVMLKGQAEGQSHAKSTGHMNFGEV